MPCKWRVKDGGIEKKYNPLFTTIKITVAQHEPCKLMPDQPYNHDRGEPLITSWIARMVKLTVSRVA